MGRAARVPVGRLGRSGPSSVWPRRPPRDSPDRGHESNGGRNLAMTPRVARIESDDGVVCERCVVADSFRLRLRGLMGRKSLGADEGVLLIGSPSIHTSFMKFPIDALFLDRELAVIGIRPD